MLKSSFIITVIFGFNTVAQLVNQIIVTRYMGASVGYDAFLAATTIPSLIIVLLSSTLIDVGAPEYIKFRTKSWLTSYILFFTLLASFLALLGIIMSPFLIRWLVGNTKSIAFITETIRYTQILFIGLPLTAVMSASSVYWYASKRVYKAPFASLLGSIALTITTILTVHSLGVLGLIISTFVAAILGIVLLVPLEQLEFKNIFQHFNVKEILGKWIPLMLGVFAMRSDGVLLRALTNTISEGHFVYINIVYKMIAAAAGLLSIGIQISLLSSLLHLMKDHKVDDAVRLVTKAKLLSVLVLGLVAVGIYIFGPLVIRTLYVGGRFTIADAQKANGIIPYFLPVLLGMGMFPVWVQPLLVIGKQKIVGIIGILGFILAYSISMILPVRDELVLTCITLSCMYLFYVIIFEYLWMKYRS